MIKLNEQNRWCLLLVFILQVKFLSGQICQTNLSDSFYNVNFAGSFFDKSVYALNISVSSSISTPLFNFTIQPQTIYTRPSFVSTNFSTRALNAPRGNLTVTSSDPNFIVNPVFNDTYALVLNTSRLNYFSPYNRYLFNLIAKETFPDRPPATSTAIVQINLENANVNDPFFIHNNQTFYISETAAVGTQFGTVYATDADNDKIEYSITSHSPEFSIDKSTGVVVVQSAFHSSSRSEYSVTITAKNDALPCLSLSRSCSTSTNITIIVTAVNKESPQFSEPKYGLNISLDENNSINKTIESLLVFDNDRGDNGLIDISFPSEQLRTTVSGLRNTAYSQFYIEQLNQTNSTRTALLRANKTFDYDKPGATRVWYLFILATDRGQPQRQSFFSLRINLRDLNDNAPVFAMNFWNYTIYRSAFNNTSNIRFLRIIASDADSGSNGIINYYIGTINVPYFRINRTTGTITLRDDVLGLSSLDINRFPIRFQVYAQDSGTPPQTSENNATVTMYFNDGNDLPPARWLNSSYEELTCSITEKFYEFYRNRTIFGNNCDFDGSIFYELTSKTSSIMTVYSPFHEYTNIPFSDVPVVKNQQIFRSGIAVIRGLHAEIQNVYLLYIRVLVNPPLIGSIRINLIDENDQIPTFDIRSIVLSVVEEEPGVRRLAQIQAFDRDVDYQNNYVTYSLNEELSDEDATGKFIVEANGTIWTNTTFGGENNKKLYRIFIRASDGVAAWDSLNANTQDFQFDIQVIGINENEPAFINGSSVNFAIDETISNGTDILYLNITDSDIDTKLNLGILTGNNLNAFSFTLLSDNSDNSTRTRYEAIGQLKVVAPLSYQSSPNYTLVLFAFDTKNIAEINVIVNLIQENTKAPYFKIMPGFNAYQYEVNELTIMPTLNGPDIEAVDPDGTPLRYEIYNTNHQLDLSSLYLSEIGNRTRIGIKSPGLSRDKPFGDPEYNFAIRVTDQNGTGLSSYAPVSIKVNDINNNAPIPRYSEPWILDENTLNPSTEILFEDFDDPLLNNTLPYTVGVVPSPPFSITPTVSDDGKFTLTYSGTLNRTSTKNVTVTLNASDKQNKSQLTTISIIVGDRLDTYPIYDGFKTIEIIYVNGYENSLQNVSLGSIYVQDLDDWYRDKYRFVSDNNLFNTSDGLLRTPERLSPGSYTLRINVTKPNVTLPAYSTIDLHVRSVDSEYVRQASTIRIKGEYPETLIDPTLGKPLNQLLDALASLLSVSVNSIIILAIRPVYQYRNPYYPPLPFEDDKQQALTDVIFYIPTLSQFTIEDTLNRNLNQFESSFKITANASGPNPCKNYICPTGTICRPTRTIQPKPSAIDTNQTSFVGINILDSPDCVNSTYANNPINTSNGCTISSFNNLPYCTSTSLPSYGPRGPCCEVLGRTFNENGGGYATYAGTSFSTLAPTRFSFEFAVPTPVIDGLVLLYGRNTTPVDDFFWISIEIYQSQLRFGFREKSFIANNININASTWYHVEYQLVDSNVRISINDCQYNVPVNDTLNTYSLSSVELYLGGLPINNILVSSLYPSLTQANTFNGCIRNVLSNGDYLDMSKATSSASSNSNECPCSLTNSCIERATRVTDIIVPWYTWLIIALVLLLLATIFTMGLLALIRKRQQIKTPTGLYTDDTRDNIIDYKDAAGEEDHSTYNLRVLKKPIYTLTDDDSDLSGVNNLGYASSLNHRRPALGDYINQKLTEKEVLSYSNDTQLQYHYEGEGSIASNLSSIESSPPHDENDYRFLYSLGPKFSRLADLYADNDNI